MLMKHPKPWLITPSVKSCDRNLFISGPDTQANYSGNIATLSDFITLKHQTGTIKVPALSSVRQDLTLFRIERVGA